MGNNNDYTGPEITINANFGEDISVQIVCNNAKEAITEYYILAKKFNDE